MANKYRVLITDSLSKEGLEILQRAGDIEIVDKEGVKGAELIAELQKSDAVIIRSGTTLTPEILGQDMGKLRLIGRAGAGVDNVHVPSATEKGIVVMNAPGGNSITTAEHTIALIFAMARSIPQAYAKLVGGKWDRKTFVGAELYNKTLGLVGAGNVGGIVADRARGLKMKVIAYDPFLSSERAAQMGIELVSLDDVYAQADIVSVHVPLTDETRGMVGKAQFAKMNYGVRIVNCARGGIVDETALLEALDSGKVAGAALDVFEKEPPPADHPLIKHPKVVSTPHLGASTHEAQINVAIATAEQTVDFLHTGTIRNAVNVPSLAGELVEMLQPYTVLADRIGTFLRQVTDSGVEQLSIRYAGEFTQYDLSGLTRSLLVGFFRSQLDRPVNTVNVVGIAQQRGVQVVETTTRKAIDFAATITAEITEKSGAKRIVGGAMFGANDGRIVRLDDFYLDGIVPKGAMILVGNQDRPGVIGYLGTLLGDAKVNIAQMHVGRIADSGEAMTIVQLDSEAPAALLEEMRKQKFITSVRQIQL